MSVGDKYTLRTLTPNETLLLVFPACVCLSQKRHIRQRHVGNLQKRVEFTDTCRGPPMSVNDMRSQRVGNGSYHRPTRVFQLLCILQSILTALVLGAATY